MNNLQHERITVLAQDLRLTALPVSLWWNCAECCQ